MAADGAVPEGDDAGQTAPEAAPAVTAETDALNELVASIEALPTKVAQKAAREEIRKSFGEYHEMTPEDVVGALQIVKAWPTGSGRSGPKPFADRTPIASLSVNVRQLLTYAAGKGIDQQHLTALISFFNETSEPRPLSELDEFDVSSITSLVDDAADGKLVFENLTGTVIVREVAPA